MKSKKVPTFWECAPEKVIPANCLNWDYMEFPGVAGLIQSPDSESVKNFLLVRTEMKKTGIFITIISMLLLFPALLMANGKFYWQNKNPPNILYQRALLIFQGGYETLILQSQYQLDNSETDDFLTWIIPVPKVPDLASMNTDDADALFLLLWADCLPKVTVIPDKILGMCFLLLTCSGIIILITVFASRFLPFLQWVGNNRERLVKYALCSLLVSLLLLIVININIASGRNGRARETPDIIKTEKTGFHDVQVVEAKEFPAWLRQNRPQSDKNDITVFNDYIKQKWSFVVAKMKMTGENGSRESVSEKGLAAPLVFRFKTDVPVYPLALTSTIGGNIKISLYLITQKKMQCDGRLRLSYAGKKSGEHTLGGILWFMKPEGFAELQLRFWLSNFEGTLTPVQMRKDLIFCFAEDDKPYKQHLIRWY